MPRRTAHPTFPVPGGPPVRIPSGTPSVMPARGAWKCIRAALLVAALTLSVAGPAAAQVRSGADVLLGDSLHLVRQGRIAVLCNSASRLADGRHILAALREQDVEVVAIFTPEHGFDLRASAGEAVRSGSRDDIPVHSLYGARRAPTPEQLEGVDLLLVDLQDAGLRWYTYVSTLALCMDVAGDEGVPVLVCDRPNPLNGVRMEGPLRTDSLRSFVGMLPVPVRHGLTIGELAHMMAGEGWVPFPAGASVRVLRMHGWMRWMYWADTGLPWYAPSPNLPDPHAALAYAATCVLEGSNLSEGRGTDHPFSLFGAPFVSGRNFAQRCTSLALPGVTFEEADFTPRARSGAAAPKFAGENCGGVRMRITDPHRFEAFRTGLEILRAAKDLYGGNVRLGSYLDLLTGAAWLRPALERGESPARVRARWAADLETFARQRLPYLLYR